MPQYLRFENQKKGYEPPKGFSGHIVNEGSDGVGMAILTQVVLEHVPATKKDDGDVSTSKEILWTKRYQCPCCATSIEALVKVSHTGVCHSENHETEGFYHIWIAHEHSNSVRDCWVTIVHLSGSARGEEGKVVYKGKTDPLPRLAHYENGVLVDESGHPIVED